jgi:hypothetical protein
MRDSNIPVYDITPLMVMNDKDTLVFGGFVLALGIVIVLIVLWAVRKIQSRPLTIAQIKIQQWNAISMDNSKKAAYEMSAIGRFFAQENDEVKVLFTKLERELEQYKYAKNVEPLSEETLQLYRDISVRLK